jgi:hypothetical protein
MYAFPPAGIVQATSPIKNYINQLLALQVYGTVAEKEKLSNLFWWVALLLLPIGIALRVVKTSLELFGKLG